MATTGITLLQDAGAIIYNKVKFSVLFKSEINGEYVLDDARRTVKGVQYTLSVEGIVSAENDINLDDSFPGLRTLLSQPAGKLLYSLRGFGQLSVNTAGGLQDMAYGPIPKVLFFQPLGNGLSAHVRWQVTFLIPELPIVGNVVGPVMQFSYETSIRYDERLYSSLSLRGIIEVPLNRSSVNSRVIPPLIVDAFRQQWENIVFDPSKFRVVSRSFNVSPDLRTCRWEYSVEELPPMDLPPGANKATGSFDVQPIHRGGSRLAFGVQWSCTLRCTYVIGKAFPRRQAAWEFYALLLFRMDSSSLGLWPTAPTVRAQQEPGPFQRGIEGIQNLFNVHRNADQVGGGFAGPANGTRPAQALMTNFSFREGIYLESDTMSFEASWILFTTFKTLLKAAGVWRWPADGVNYGNVQRRKWATSLNQFVGWRSWLSNQIDPNSQVIVDMGGGQPPQAGLAGGPAGQQPFQR